MDVDLSFIRPQHWHCSLAQNIFPFGNLLWRLLTLAWLVSHPSLTFAQLPEPFVHEASVDVELTSLPPPPPYWWAAGTQHCMRANGSIENSRYVSLENLIVSALHHSSQLKVYTDLPIIRETSIVEAQAAFDSTVFLDNRWDSLSDPVGNTLTTGGAARYENNQLSSAAGVRRRTISGGRVELAQRIGFQDTNSNFFVPDPQGTAKLVLNFTQPLMRGRGREYSQSIMVLATIDKDVAELEFSRQVQAHLLEVSRAYWGLFLERALLVQKRNSVERAEWVRTQLNSRTKMDAVRPQLQRAEAEVANRRAELVRAGLAVENAEARIRTLVNDPLLGEATGNIELIPVQWPSESAHSVDLTLSLQRALENRPEINQALEQIKAGCLRLQVSKNELLPSLNFITETYLTGLQGNGQIGDAFLDQFREGRPSYTVGLQYEIPFGNRLATARKQRREIELRQLQNQFATTTQTLELEVEVAVRELQTAYTEMDAQRRAAEAFSAQMDYQQKRWELLPDEDGGAALKLDNLLVAQERLLVSENSHVQALVTYNLAIINHLRATGELLKANRVSWADSEDEINSTKSRHLFMENSIPTDLNNSIESLPDTSVK